ncbi:MAG: sugar transferase [Candidatus Moranbacteria bacterium]|nr:sugar transferase [Candidatus Moranbacteria bacterium]
MKKAELFFSALQVPVDYVMLVLAGSVAFYLRRADVVQEVKPILYDLSVREFLQILLLAAAYFVAVFAIEGLYNIRSNKGKVMEIYRVGRATLIALMGIVLVLFLEQDWFSSRFVILTGAVLAVVFVSAARIALRYFQLYLMAVSGIGVRKVLLIGGNGFAESFKKLIKANPRLGYASAGHISKIDFDKIRNLKKLKGVDEIIECDPKVNKRKLFRLKEFCIRNRIAFKYVPTLIQTTNFDLQVFLGEPIIEVKNTPLDGWGKILKRVFDIAGSIVGIIIFGPIMLATAMLIWLESGRPVIYFNRRVNHKGGEFDLYKFRYMKKEYSHGKQFSPAHNRKALKYQEELIEKQSARKGPVYKIKDDPRKTKLGFYIEKLSLDEFPQFFNVLKGEMSLVGPRPHQPMEVEKYQDHQRRVLTVKPGITGMAQISGRSDLAFEQEAKLDIYYIENWSLWKDIQIIFRTIPTLLRKRRN